MAAKHGAVAILLGDNAPGEQSFLMSMEPDLIPAFYIWQSTYNKLLGIENKNIFINEYADGNLKSVENPVKDRISDFSSWGPTPNLGIKPEIKP